MPSLVKGLARTSFIPGGKDIRNWGKYMWKRRQLTELEIGLDIFLSNVGCHGDDGDLRRHHPDHGRGGNAV